MITLPPATASEELQEVGESWVYVAAAGAGVATVEGLVAPGPGSVSQAAGYAASGIVAGIGAFMWIIGDICNPTPAATCQLPEDIISGIDEVDPQKRFSANIPDRDNLLSAAKASSFIESPLGEATIEYIETSSVLLGNINGWVGTLLNMAAAEKMDRQDLLLMQAEFLQEYAQQIKIAAENNAEDALVFGNTFKEFHEAEDIFVTSSMIMDEKLRLEEEGFATIQMDILSVFGFDTTAIDLMRENNLEILSEAEPSVVATHDFTKLVGTLDKLVDEVEKYTEQSVLDVQERQEAEELMVSIETGEGKAGETVEITVTFNDMEGNDVEHVNYNIMATQGSETVLDETDVHDHDGMMSHTTMALPMDASDEMPVDVSVEFLGFGIDPPFTGPIGHVETAQIVPEFGTITMVVLAAAIVGIIVLTGKIRAIPDLYLKNFINHT